jgi:hypothetical protein
MLLGLKSALTIALLIQLQYVLWTPLKKNIKAQGKFKSTIFALLVSVSKVMTMEDPLSDSLAEEIAGVG